MSFGKFFAVPKIPPRYDISNWFYVAAIHLLFNYDSSCPVLNPRVAVL